MKLSWQIEDDDIKKVKLFYDAQKNNSFILNRIERNVKKILPQFTSKGTEYSCRFFFYYPAIVSNEIIVLPLSALKVESEEVPLVEINERFKFSDYEGDTSEKVEFIMDLIMKSIVLKEDHKAVVITFSTSPKR